MKRIVLFVEGDGELDAIPTLIKRLITESDAEVWKTLQIDNAPFKVGQVGKLLKDDCVNWKRWLQACLKRPNVGGVLLILDGDAIKVAGSPFCAAIVARKLAKVARQVGAAQSFSVAIVFACLEYESWLLAGAEALAGETLSDGRTIPLDFKAPDGDLEAAPRDAKGWIRKRIPGGYKETRDQLVLTRVLDLKMVRDRNLRSFRRLESAVKSLIDAIRQGVHIASPE